MSEQIDDSYVNGVYVKADGTEQVEISPACTKRMDRNTNTIINDSFFILIELMTFFSA